jgi:beta-lactamase regulating signal transducer with metallopeptidase domain/uncharacterized GH25 family protein
LIIAWMIVVGLLLAYILAKVWAIDRRLRRTRFVADPQTIDTVAKMAALLETRQIPNVYLAPAVVQPFVWGLFRGDIYLPPEFATTGSDEQRRAILTHELAHILRWDAAANLFQIIVQLIFFFHPLIWWANAKIRQEREKCCDEIVMSGLGIRPRVYCEAIVNMLALEHQSSQATPPLAVTGSTKNIAERINSILTPERKFCRRPSRFCVLMVFFVAAGLLPAAFVAATRAENPVPPAPSKAVKSDAKAKEVASGTKHRSTDKWEAGQVMDFRMINAETKEPIPDVTLELQFTGKGIEFQDVKIQKTDADGWSRIRLPDLPTTEVRVYPSKEGFVPLRVYWGANPYPVIPKSITIPLEPGKVIGGTILNEAGEPISDVTVTIHYWGDSASLNPHLRPHIDNATATTDKAGRWQLDIMPAVIEDAEQSLKIYLTHPGYVSDHLERSVISIPVTPQPPVDKLFDQTSVMIMREGETIEGKVIDSKGRPISNAKIFDNEFYGARPYKPRAETDQDGNFRIAGVQFGELDARGHLKMKLMIQATGQAPELVDVQRSSPLLVELNPGQSIHGRVVDQNGNPVDGVTVSAFRWRDRERRLDLETTTNAEGKFRLTDAPTDEVKYWIYKEGYMTVQDFIMLPSTDPHSVTIKAPLRIVGSVVDAETGKPLDRFSLIDGIDYEDGRNTFWMRLPFGDTRFDPNGRFEKTLRQEGFSYRLRVEAEGYMPGVSRIVRPYNPDLGAVTIDFKLNTAKPIAGTVLDLNGKPLANAKVYLATQHLNINNQKIEYTDSPHVTTSASGEFEFPPEVDPYCIVVVHEQGLAMTTEKDFEMPPRISIKPWTKQNETLQIIRKPAAGQWVDFPGK